MLLCIFSDSSEAVGYHYAWNLNHVPEATRVLLGRHNWEHFLTTNGHMNEEMVHIFYATFVVLKGRLTSYEAMLRGEDCFHPLRLSEVYGCSFKSVVVCTLTH